MLVGRERAHNQSKDPFGKNKLRGGEGRDSTGHPSGGAAQFTDKKKKKSNLFCSIYCMF
jgi:hypothetical protein